MDTNAFSDSNLSKNIIESAEESAEKINNYYTEKQSVKPRINNNDNDDNDNDYDDEDEVINYFNNLPDKECEPLPNFNDKIELDVGKQIRIIKPGATDRSLDPDIYIIIEINTSGTSGSNNTYKVKSTSDGTEKTIEYSHINNIVNINPSSLFVDKDFLEKITTDNRIHLDKIIELKTVLRTKILAKFNSKKLDIKDSLMALREETFNINNAEGKVKTLMDEIANLPNNNVPDSIGDFIMQIKDYAVKNIKESTDCYYIQNLNSVLDVLVFLGLLTSRNKDLLLNSYIFVCECLSVTVIAGIVEMGITRECWIFYILYIFFNNVIYILSINQFIIDYAITPAIVIYLYTNMNTITFCAEKLVDKINEILSLTICTMNVVIKHLYKNFTKNNVSTATIVNSSSNSNISTNSVVTLISLGAQSTSEHSSSTLDEITIFTKSSFPSLKDLEPRYTRDIIEQLKNITRSQGSSTITSSSQESSSSTITSPSSTVVNSLASLSPPPSPRGGKIKRSRVTKKYKRMTIRRSKRSKKMKGGKRTRSTKKRRVVRRRKHNTKKY